MTRSFLAFCCLLLSQTPSMGQFSMEGYLSNAVQAVEIKSIQEQLYFIDQHGFKSPILREVEFRMRVTHFGEGLDNYKLRFSPLNPYEIGANKAYRVALEQQMSAQLKLSLNEVLKGRYQLLIDHFFLVQQLNFLAREISFYQELITMASEQPQRFSVKDIIRTDKSLLKANIRQLELVNEQLQLEYLIKQTYDYQGTIDWTTEELATIDQIQSWLNAQKMPLLDNNLLVKNEEQKNLLEDAELKIKKQESFSNIGYLQVEYRPDENSTVGESMGLQIGVNIPVVNADKPDLERRRLKMLENIQEFNEDKNSIHTSMNFAQMQLSSLLVQHNMIDNKIKSYDAYRLSAQSNASLDVLLELREYQFELKALELRIFAEVLEKYIILLSFDGQLAEDPYVNYLSKAKNSFSIEL